MTLETTASLRQALDVIEQRILDLQTKKDLIATAVTGKDVPTNGSDSFQKMEDNIDSIKTKLPILEGDAGVAEDVEGNVYGVDKIKEIHTYDIGVRATQEWVYAPSENNYVNKLDVDSQGNIYCGYGRIIKISPQGEEIWFHTVGGLTSIKIDKDDNIYYSTTDKIGKINPSKEIIWGKTSVSNKGLVIDSNYLYSGNSYNVSKCTLEGDIIWTRGGTDLISSIAVDSEGNVYYGTGNKEVHKLSPERDRIWSLGGDVPHIYSLAVDSEGYVYAGYAGMLRKITPGGEEVWRTKRGTDNINEIRIDSANNVYCATGGNKVYKFSPDSAEYWEFQGHTNMVFCLAVDNKGYVYSGSADRSIRKIKDNYNLGKVAILKEREVQ